jgi:hypothetical protein
MILQIFPILENLIHQYREGAGRGGGRKNGDRGERKGKVVVEV